MTIYYVDDATGSDSNSGTSTGSAWKTITKANTVLGAGDTVYIRAGTYTNQQVAPSTSGTSSNRITYENYQTEEPVITFSSLGIPYVLANRSYVTIKGIDAYGGPGFYTDAKVDVFCEFDNTTHCIIDDCDMSFAEGYSSFRFQNGSDYNKIINSVIDAVGYWDKFDYTGVHDDTGSGIYIASGNDYNLFENNSIDRCGHDLTRIDGNYNVFKGNTFKNTFEIYSGPGFTHKEGDVQPGDAVGNRSFSLKGNSNYNVVENNWIEDIPEAVDNRQGGQCKVGGTANIVRNNIFLNGTTQGLACSSVVGSTMENATNNKIFHNNIYNCRGGAWAVDSNASSWPSPSGSIFKNNIVYKTHQDPSDWDVEFNFGTSLNSFYGSHFVSSEIAYNCIAYDSGATYQRVKSGVGTQTLSYMETNYSSIFHDNVQANPVWTAADPAVLADFELAGGSPCLAAADNLTVTVGGGTGTSVTVADAGYFYDGFGITDGDFVQIGSNSAVQITNVNYSTNVITLSSAITWSNGDGVNLPYDGAAPNIGAVQGASAGASSTLYVSPSGTSGGAGTSGDPLDLLTANANAVAGDTVIMLAGTYTTPIAPTASGTSGNEILYKNDAGAQVYVRASSGSYELDLDGSRYVNIKATDVGVNKGIILGGASISSLGKNIRLSSAQNIIIDGVRHQFSDGTTNDGLSLIGTSGDYTQDVVIANSEMYAHLNPDWNKGDTGTVTDQDKFEAPVSVADGVEQTDGSTAYVQRVLFNNTTFEKYGGNHQLSIKAGDKIIYRSCVFDGSWSDLVDGETTTNGNGLVGSCQFLEGSTCTVTSNNAKQGLEGVASAELISQVTIGDGRLMIEKCLFKNMGYAPGSVITTNKLQWRGYIHRNNVHYEESQGLGTFKLTTLDGALSHNLQHQFYYNNTIVRCKNSGMKFVLDISASGANVIGDIHYLNNLHTEVGYRTDLETGTKDADASLAFDTLGDGTLDDVFGIDARGNLFDTSATFYASEHTPTDMTLTQIETDFSASFQSNTAGTPTFKGGATTALAVYNDFEPTDTSDGLDAGQHLTTTTASGASTTTIPVTEVGFFFDGWGILDELGAALPGDTIRVEQSSGAPTTVTVTGVTYPAYGTNGGSIQVSPAISFPLGAKIWVDYTGAAPDVGAIQNTGEFTGGTGGDPGYVAQYSNTASSTTILTITPGATIADGKFLIAFIVCREDRTMTPPAGWTQVQNDGSSGTGADNPRFYVFTRVTASETASYTFTASANSRMVGTILEYDNAVTNPLEVEALGAESSFTTTHTLPALVATSTNSDLLAVTVIGAESTNATISQPAGYTELADNIVTAGAGSYYLRMEVCRKDGPGGNIGSTTATSSAGAYSITYHAALAGVSQDSDVSVTTGGLAVAGIDPTVVLESSGNPQYSTIHSNTSTSTTAFVITPSVSVSDDVLMVAIINSEATSTITPPAGWTTVKNDTGAGTSDYDPRLGIYTKVAASEGASYTFTASPACRFAGAILEYDNPNTVPVEVDVLGAETSATTTHDIGELTGTSSLSDLVTVVAGGGTAASTTATPPSGYVEIADIDANEVVAAGVSILGTPLNIDDGESYTPETGDSERLVVVGVAYEYASGATGITSVKLGGVTMTQLNRGKHSTTGSGAGHWYLKEADIPVGSSTLEFTWAGTYNGLTSGTIYTLAGVDQSTVSDDTQKSSFTSTSTPSRSVTSTDNSLVLVSASSTDHTLTWTNSSGLTERRDAAEASNNFRIFTADKLVPSGSADTLNFTLSSSDSGQISAVVIKPSAGTNRVTSLAVSRKESPGGTIAATTSTTSQSIESITYHLSVAGAIVFGDIDVNATTGALNLAAHDATIETIFNGNIDVSLGTLDIAKTDPFVTVSSVVRVDCTVGTVSIADQNANVELIKNLDIASTIGVLGVDGYNVTIQMPGDIDLTPAVQDVAVLGYLTDTNFDHSMSTTAADIGVAGSDPTIIMIFEYDVNVTTGAMTVDALATTTQLIGNGIITATTGATTVDALDTTTQLIFELDVSATTGTVTVDGYDTDTNFGNILAVTVGTMKIRGHQAWLNNEAKYGMKKETLDDMTLIEEELKDQTT